MKVFARRLMGATLALPLAAVIAGCASNIDEGTVSTLFMLPGQWDIYTCDEIENLAKSYVLRQADLEKLMARTSQGTGGTVVNAMFYQSEYLQNKSRLKELKRVANDRQCVVNSKWSSGRAVF